MEPLVSNVDVMNTPAMRKSGLSKQQIERTAKEFESVFMAQMLKPMWEGIETNGMFGGGPGEDVMRDMMIQEYGKAMVRQDNYGLSSSIMDAMIRIQEQASSGTI